MHYWNYRRIWMFACCLIVVAMVTITRLYVDDVTDIDGLLEAALSSPQKFFSSRDFDFAEKSKLQDWDCSVSQILKVLESYDDLRKFDHCQRILYNRVPKCGSRTLLNVFSNLSSSQNFNLFSDPKLSYLTSKSVISFVKNITHLESPYIYSRHIHYVNFSKFQIPPPIYINVIRDPISRLISHYHYNMYGSSNAPLASPRPQFNISLEECVRQRKGTCLGKFQTMMPYFCGLDKECRTSDETERLAQAKKTVRENFLVVGITEDLPAFIEVLENLMPNFFTNAGTIFSQMETDLWNKTKTVHKEDISDETRHILREYLAVDYEFYDFVRARFYTLLEKIRSFKRKAERKKARESEIDREWNYIYEYH